MTRQELERRLARAAEHAAPDGLDAVLSRCGAQNGSVVEMKDLRSDPNVREGKAGTGRKLRPWLAAACAALVLLGAGGGLFYQNSYAVASVVSLDVNPSIELTVNRRERVLSCTALNEEAAAVLFGMDGGRDLKGVKLDVAVNAVVGALVQAGYMDSISSAILISVEDKDQARAQRLQAELVASVDGVLQDQAPGTSVLSQVVDAGTERGNTQTAISGGKAALVRKVLEMNGGGDETFDRLAALSVEELNDLLKTGEKRIPIGKSAAALAAEEYAGTLAVNAVTADVDPELDELPPCYEVELKTAWGEFDYLVDAFTGEVLSGQRDLLNTAGTSGLTEAQAFDAAAGRFGAQYPALDGNNLLDAVTRLDQHDGRQVYYVNFTCGGYHFQYEIDARTGAALSWSTDYPGTPAAPDPAPAATPGTDREPTPVATPAPEDPSQAQDVGRDAAVQAALAHAGLSESQITGLAVERDWDDGRLEYEIEFWCGGVEYDYTIDGGSCAVLGHEQDHHSTHHDTPSPSQAQDVGRDAAVQAALTHAGLSESQVTGLKVEQDWDDGRLEYEIEFWCSGVEYDYTIDGRDGSVLSAEQETDG